MTFGGFLILLASMGPSLFILGTAIAPKWSARLVLHPAAGALAALLRQPRPSFDDTVEVARQFRPPVVFIVGLLALSLWIGALPVAIVFAAVLILLIVMLTVLALRGQFSPPGPPPS